MILVLASSTPYGFKIQSIQGFVKEIVVNDDPGLFYNMIFH